MAVTYDDPAVDSPYAEDPAIAQARADEERIAQLEALGSMFQREFEQRKSDKRGIEDRWLEDLRLYNGQYDPDVLAQIRSNQGSKVFLSVGRTKTDAVEAHHANLLLPTDDRNWDIQPTPVPEGAPLEASNATVHTTPQGQPVSAADMVNALREEMQTACDAMRETIDDQLVECDYPAHVRKTLHQGCVLGTGVMRGPVLKNKKRKRWAPADGSTRDNIVWVKTSSADTRPAIENVNVWDFYPSSGIGDITQSEGVFVRHWVSRQQLRDLQYDVDFSREAIQRLLEANPEAPRVTDDRLMELRILSGEIGVMQKSFEMIEYAGPVDASDLIACGVDVPDDTLATYKASVFIVGDIVIKAALELMEGSTEQDFYVWQLAKDDTTLWGFGVPRLMRTSVLIANAVFRMMIDNGGLSVGGILVYDQTQIAPADGTPNLTPRKTFFKVGESNLPIRNLIDVIEIPSQLEWLMQLFNLAIRLCDEESALPMIAQGDQAAHITKTKGGMSMLMDAAGVMLRRSVKGFDDNITMPVIDAMYAWNMLYNQNASIKGDFNTKARGSSALLEREQQMESFTQFVQFLNSNPLFHQAADWPAILEEGTRLLRVNRGSLLQPVAKIKALVEQMANQPPPPSDRVQAAQITAAASNKNAEISAQAVMGAAQVKAGVDQQEIQALMQELAVKTGLAREEIAGKLGLAHMALDHDAQRFNTNLAVHLKTGTGVPA